MEIYQNFAETESEIPTQEQTKSVISDLPIIDQYKIPKTVKGNTNIFKFITDLVLQIIRQFWWISIFMITTSTIDHHFKYYQNKMMMYGLLATISLTAILLPNNLDFTKI